MSSRNTDIQESFNDTLGNSNLTDIGEDALELSIDHFLDNGILKEIPIVKTFVSVIKIGANIHDKLFLKKILSFMREIQDIRPNDRAKMINSIDASKQYHIKAGEKLLYITYSSQYVSKILCLLCG